jgi:hypothetical protein
VDDHLRTEELHVILVRPDEIHDRARRSSTSLIMIRTRIMIRTGLPLFAARFSGNDRKRMFRVENSRDMLKPPSNTRFLTVVGVVREVRYSLGYQVDAENSPLAWP